MTGQTGWLVAPRYSVTPLWKGSVFDHLMNTPMRCGLSLLSKERLSSDRWVPGSWMPWHGTVNSLIHRNLKTKMPGSMQPKALCWNESLAV